MKILDINTTGKIAEVKLDNGEVLTLPYLIVFDNRLDVGQEIDDNIYIKIVTDAMCDKCFGYSTWYLSKYSATEKTLRQKLREKEYTSLAINMTMDRLKDLGFIDDYRFAERFVASRLHKMGKYKLKSELYRKGVSNDIITEVLDQIPDEEIYQNALAVAKKWYNSHDLETIKDKDKFYRYMQYRGFGFDVIKSVMYQIKEKYDDREDI